MTHIRSLVLAGAVAVAAGCGGQQQAQPQQQGLVTAPTPVGTIRQVMENMVATNADVLFNSVAVRISAAGTEERQPRTDEDWAAVEHAAFTIVEATNLLLMDGRRVAKPEEENTSEDPSELPPIKIQEKITQNRDLWISHVNKLRAVALQAYKATTDRSVQGLFDVGAPIDEACESCHLEFWYPSEKTAGAAGAPTPGTSK